MDKRETIILLGAGGHALSCIDVIERQDRFRIVGLIGKQEQVGQSLGGYPVIGSDYNQEEWLKLSRYFLVCVGQIKEAETRKRLFGELSKKGREFPVILSPEAYVSPSAKVGSGTIVHHKAIVNGWSQVGQNCIINSSSLIEHGSSVGHHCHISTGALVNGDVRIADEVFVGSGAVLKQGISIGRRSVVGMGAIVKENVPENGWIPSRGKRI